MADLDTLQKLVDAETFKAYAATASDVTDAITRAYYELSALYDDTDKLPIGAGTVGAITLQLANNNHNLAVTKLAVAILVNARQHVKGRNTDVTPISIDMMITDEIRRLLLVGDETDADDVDEGVMWDNVGPTNGWDASGVRL